MVLVEEDGIKCVTRPLPVVWELLGSPYSMGVRDIAGRLCRWWRAAPDWLFVATETCCGRGGFFILGRDVGLDGIGLYGLYEFDAFSA